MSPHRQPSDVWGIDPSQSAYCADLLCSVNDVESSRIFPSLWPRATTCNPTLQHPNPLDCDFVKAEFTTSCHWRLLYINWYNIEVPTVDLRWVPLCAFAHFSVVFQKKIVCIVSPPLFPRELMWLTQYFSRVPTWNSRAVALSWRVTKDLKNVILKIVCNSLGLLHAHSLSVCLFTCVGVVCVCVLLVYPPSSGP